MEKESSEVSLQDEPYQVVQVGEDKEAMKQLAEQRYQRKLAARQAQQAQQQQATSNN